MELKSIYECQEILDTNKEIKTREERECDKLLRNKDTLDWLRGRKDNLDKEIKELKKNIVPQKEIFIGPLKSSLYSYDIFCLETDLEDNQKNEGIYISSPNRGIHINRSSCDRGLVMEELKNNYEICVVPVGTAILFLKSLEISKDVKCGPFMCEIGHYWSYCLITPDYENQKEGLKQKFQDIDMLEQQLLEYQGIELIQNQLQHGYQKL